MADPIIFQVVTGNEDRKIVGTDSTIAVMPQGCYTKPSPVTGERLLLVQRFQRLIRDLAMGQAADLGEVLHHAQFTITRDPAVVESWGMLHDCERCRQSVDSALRRLRRSSIELVVGQLWWAEPDGGD